MNANFRPSRLLLSVSIRVFISVFTLSMAFEVLGVAEEDHYDRIRDRIWGGYAGISDSVRPGRSGSGPGVFRGAAGEESKDSKEDELSPL